jgi:multidrug efflux pump subunit AcrB
LTPLEDRKRSQAVFQKEMQPLLSAIPGARISFNSSNFGEGLGIYLSGEDPAQLQAVAERVTRDLRTIPGLGAVTSSAALLRPEIAIKPDFERAAQLGVVTASLAEAIRIGTTGDVDFRLAKFNLPARQIPIRVQIEESARNTVDLLHLLRVPARSGSVPLESVASIELSSGPAEINRYDRYRNVVLNASLNGQMLGVVQKQIDALPSLRNLPEGVRRVQAGDTERYQELFLGFGLAMIAGIFCVYGVLALLFNDLLQPLTILVALPLSIGGAVGALAIRGLGLTLPSLIGILMLMGIAVKNSILLVDYAVMAEQQGMTQREALLDACGKRARPIIMTSLAMAAGMAPTAADFFGGSGFRTPMAIAVLGGLITSTVLSLLVVPAAYTYVADVEAWWRRKRHYSEISEDSREERPRLTELDPLDARAD